MNSDSESPALRFISSITFSTPSSYFSSTSSALRRSSSACVVRWVAARPMRSGCHLLPIASVVVAASHE